MPTTEVIDVSRTRRLLLRRRALLEHVRTHRACAERQHYEVRHVHRERILIVPYDHGLLHGIEHLVRNLRNRDPRRESRPPRLPSTVKTPEQGLIKIFDCRQQTDESPTASPHAPSAQAECPRRTRWWLELSLHAIPVGITNRHARVITPRLAGDIASTRTLMRICSPVSNPANILTRRRKPRSAHVAARHVRDRGCDGPSRSAAREHVKRVRERLRH